MSKNGIAKKLSRDDESSLFSWLAAKSFWLSSIFWILISSWSCG